MVIILNFLTAILVAVSLSMDAFSLALSLGTLNISIKKSLILSITVGLLHFFMPILGFLLGFSFVNKLHIDTHLFSGIIFLYISIQMFKEIKKNEVEPIIKLNFLGIVAFAIGVSLDSFGIGFTLTPGILTTTIIFALFSFTFTFLGLLLGKLLNKYIGSIAIIFGASTMTTLSLINFVKFLCFN